MANCKLCHWHMNSTVSGRFMATYRTLARVHLDYEFVAVEQLIATSLPHIDAVTLDQLTIMVNDHLPRICLYRSVCSTDRFDLTVPDIIGQVSKCNTEFADSNLCALALATKSGSE